MKTKIQIVYSQFIELDVNLANQPAQWIKFCKIKDFEKWCGEEKGIGIVSINYMSNVEEITRLLKEFSHMNFSDWRINTISIKGN